MRPNLLRAAFAADRTAVGGWLSIDSSYAAEVVGHAGFDAVVVDAQHGMVDPGSTLHMLQALSATPAMPMVRVAANTLADVNRALDAGAYGVICPLVNTVDEARRFARACRYPPQGERSFGPARGLLYGGADYPARANEDVMALAMIETRAALEAVEAIASVDSLDGLFVGPSDLGLALGLGPGASHEHPVLAAAIDRVAAACRAAGTLAGIWCSSAEMARSMSRRGYRFVVPGHDVIWLKAEMARRLAVLRAAD